MATHCQSVNSLEEYFTKASREKEELELKFERAVNLQHQLAELKSSEDFFSQNDINKLKAEAADKERRLIRSIALHQQMLQANEKINSNKSSGDFLKPEEEQQIQNRIQFKKSVIEKAVDLQGKITQTERNPEFLNEPSLETMKKKLELLNNVLKKIQKPDQTTEETRKELQSARKEVQSTRKELQCARTELQCTSCSRFPEIGTPVFSCLEHHLLCLDCLKNNLRFCLICKQNLTQIPVSRNSLAERMIKTFQ
jgi:hypothetical protein